MDLPSHSKIHHVFHVSLLRKAKGDGLQVVPLPYDSYDNYPIVKPMALLGSHLPQRQGQVFHMLLVQWESLLIEDASWVDLHVI